MNLIPWLVVTVAGIGTAVQSGVNVTLSRTLDQPVLAAIVVALSSAVVYLMAAPFLGLGWPATERIAAVPWWAWTGGLLSALYILSMTLFAGQIGAAAFMGVTVVAAIAASLVLDHFGWLGLDVHPLGAGRALGGVFMLAGVVLVCLF